NWSGGSKVSDNQEDALGGYSSAVVEVHRVHSYKRISYNSTHDIIHEDSVSSDCRGSAVSDPEDSEFITGTSDAVAGVATMHLLETTRVLRRVEETPCALSSVSFDVKYKAPNINSSGPMGGAPALTYASLPPTLPALPDT